MDRAAGVAGAMVMEESVGVLVVAVAAGDVEVADEQAAKTIVKAANNPIVKPKTINRTYFLFMNNSSFY